MRWENSWQYLSIVHRSSVHFIVPYALLLSRDLKRNAGKLRVIATWILFARIVDYYWHVAPEFHKDGLSAQPARRGAAAGARRDLHFAVRVAAAPAARCCR